MKRAGIIAVSITVLALLLAGVRSYRMQKEWIDHRPYPLGATGLSYVAKHLQEFDGQEFAIFNFGNAEGVRLKLEGTIAAWDEATQSWKERAWDLELLPNRRVKKIVVGQEGKWKLQIRAYTAPTLGEKLSFRVRKARPAGGLMGAWSSPEMWGSSPSTNGTAIAPAMR